MQVPAVVLSSAFYGEDTKLDAVADRPTARDRRRSAGPENLLLATESL